MRITVIPSLALGLIALTLGGIDAHAQAGPAAEDVALRAPPPSEIAQVIPGDGADVPTNVRVTFKMDFQEVAAVEGEILFGDDGGVLQSEQIACPDACVGVFNIGPLPAGSSPSLTLGTNLEFQTTLSYDVDGGEDQTPPELGGDHVITSQWEAYNGALTGYTGEVNIPRATDNYGIAYYEVHTNASQTPSEDGMGLTTILFGEPTTLQASFYLYPEATEVCVRVTAVDWAGHSRASEILCEDVVPPTDEELEETVEPAFGCGGGGPVVAQPGLALFGLLGGLRLRRRLRALRRQA